MEETDQFIGRVIKVGESLMLTIPARNVKFSGLKIKDVLKVYYKKKIND